MFDPIDCNLSSLGGPSGGAVTDSIFQEIDLKTGLVRREWNSLDHVALSDSYSSATSANTIWPFDYFHLNSIDQLADGTTLISARNTSTLYELDTRTGQVLTRIGGKHSSVKLTAGAATAYQHDATMLANGTISVFDNGGVPKVHAQSRGLILAVNAEARTDTVVAEYEHSAPPLSSGSQGDVQALADGNVFIGWGAEPYFSEFSASGQLLYDAHMAWLLPVLPQLPLLLDRLAERTAGDRRRAAGRPGDRLRQLERRHPHGQLARARRPERAAAHARGQRRAQRLRDGHRRARRRGLRGGAGARRRRRSARHLAHDRRLIGPSRAHFLAPTHGSRRIDLLRLVGACRLNIGG